MDQTTVLVVALAALAVVYFGAPRVIGLLVGGAVGAVTGNTRQRGLAATRKVIEFSAPCTGAAIIARLQETLELGTPAAQGLQLGGTDEEGTCLLVIVGSSATPMLSFVVDTEEASEGCTGRAGTASWVEEDRHVVCTEQIERLHKHVRAAVTHLGGTFTETESDQLPTHG
jgi:hypothetical protein